MLFLFVFVFWFVSRLLLVTFCQQRMATLNTHVAWRHQAGGGATVLWRRCSCPNLPLWHFKAFRILERGVDNVQSIKIHTQTHTRQTHARCSARTLRIRNASKILICCWRSWFWHITLAFNSIRTHRYTQRNATHTQTSARRACVTHKARDTHRQKTQDTEIYVLGFPFFLSFFFLHPLREKVFCAWASARSASLFELLTFNATRRPQLDSLTGPGRPRKQQQQRQQRQQQQRQRRQSFALFHSLSHCFPFSAVCRAFVLFSLLLLLTVAVVATDALVLFSFLFCLPHSLTRLTTNEAAWRQHHKTYDFCQISGHAQSVRQLESV